MTHLKKYIKNIKKNSWFTGWLKFACTSCWYCLRNKSVLPRHRWSLKDHNRIYVNFTYDSKVNIHREFLLFHLMVLTPLSKKVESTLNMSLFFFQFLLTCISVKEKMNQQWYKIQLPFAFSWVLFKVLYLLIIHWQWFLKNVININYYA